MPRGWLTAVILATTVLASCEDGKPCAEGLVLYLGECLAEPPACGQPPGDCTSTLDATSCDAAGGMFDPTWRYCNCGTSDGGCACWRDEHCQGFCLGDQTHVDACRATEVGTCSDSNQTGCLCIATVSYETGQPGFDLVCIN